MTEQEREQLIKKFQKIQAEIGNVQERCEAIEQDYPGFKGDQMFIHLSNALYIGEGYAASLADYIGVATAEDWTEAP